VSEGSVQDAAALDPQRLDLEEILQTGLEVGVQVHLAGGYTARTSAAMKRVALAMGAEKAEPAVTSTLVGLTVHREGWSRTALRSASQMGVNFSELTELSRFSKRAHRLPRTELLQQLAGIRHRAKRYPTYLVLPMLGISCLGFAMIFGADLVGGIVAGLGGLVGATVRHFLIKAKFKPFVFCALAAFLSSAAVLILQSHTSTPDAALAACVLYLVPGVPLLNGTADLLTAFYLNGVVRLTMCTVIAIGSALGITLALQLWGAA
jgi:uncharacterized membrane protein YjjP (DUF1212 family)